jgi:hypothetical protein
LDGPGRALVGRAELGGGVNTERPEPRRGEDERC